MTDGAVIEASSPIKPPKVLTQPCYVDLLQHYPWDWHIMLAIEKAESHCRASSVSQVDYDGIRDYGVMQLHGDAVFNPAANISIAFSIWQRQGYRAWTSYQTGLYKQYE